MKHANFCGNINHNWKQLISHLSTCDGSEVTPDPDRWNERNPEYKKIYNIWEQSNFNMQSIKWINYYPDVHFPYTINSLVSSFTGKTCHRSWISRVDPGYCAAWHWDVDDNENKYLEKGRIYRYSVFISDPTPGQSFNVENQYLVNQEPGAVWEWENHNAWHAGMNASLSPKYMLHFLGY